MPTVVVQVAASLAIFPALYTASIACFPSRLSALQPKRRAWVLTLFSSLYLTLASSRFLVEFLRTGGDVKAYKASVQHDSGLASLSEQMCSAFLAFLFWDTVIGHSLGTINLLTGYIHHGAYSLVMLYTLATDQAWVFALFAVLELPTFILALTTIVPQWRHDRLFAGVFAATRLVLHGWKLGHFAREALRKDGELSLGPVVLISLALALHIHWFANNVKGMIARHRRASAPPSPFPTPRTSASVPAVSTHTLTSAEAMLLSPSESSADGSEDGEWLKTPFDGPAIDLERKASRIPEITI